jgi:hypothetical protein
MSQAGGKIGEGNFHGSKMLMAMIYVHQIGACYGSLWHTENTTPPPSTYNACHPQQQDYNTLTASKTSFVDITRKSASKLRPFSTIILCFMTGNGAVCDFISGLGGSIGYTYRVHYCPHTIHLTYWNPKGKPVF